MTGKWKPAGTALVSSNHSSVAGSSRGAGEVPARGARACGHDPGTLVADHRWQAGWVYDVR